MRRTAIYALAGLCTFAAGPVSAQGISLGVKGGAAFATLAGDDVSNVQNKAGLSFGGSLGINVTPMFAIQPEVIFAQKGTTNPTGQDAIGDLNLSYVEIPLLARLSVPTPGRVNPYVFAGPAVRFEVDCSTDQFADAPELVDCAEADVLERKSTDFGVVGGAGLGFGMGPGEATLDVRYDLGLSSISDAETVADVKNRAFTVMVGYMITLGL